MQGGPWLVFALGRIQEVTLKFFLEENLPLGKMPFHLSIPEVGQAMP
jgi:hypothetical protein